MDCKTALPESSKSIFTVSGVVRSVVEGKVTETLLWDSSLVISAALANCSMSTFAQPELNIMMPHVFRQNFCITENSS